jgi:hypothetical protein
MRLELGSPRALACADRRPRRSESRGMTSPNGGVREITRVVGEGANHRTRGRVRSPTQPHGYGLRSVTRRRLRIIEPRSISFPGRGRLIPVFSHSRTFFPL